MDLSHEETAGSIETAFGVWRAVGTSKHVLDGGSPHHMVMGNFVGLNIIADGALFPRH